MANKCDQNTGNQKLPSTEIDPLISKICEAVFANKSHLSNHLTRSNNNDHSHIEDFQSGICDWLNQDPSVNKCFYSWQTEVKVANRKEKDSIDIMGNPKKGNTRCIIEIDACRQDQVAAKFLSRLTLWGLDEPITYVALLYPRREQNNINACEKYVFYANTIIKRINSNSKVVGIFVDVHGNMNNGQVTIWDYNIRRGSYIVKTNNGVNIYIGMPKCANVVIGEYVKTNPTKTYKDLKDVFGKFINDKVGKARYKEVGLKSSDGIDLYSYTDFRGKGPRSLDWYRFIDICSKIGIDISRIWLTLP